MALETLSYHKDIKITQMQTNVSSFYLNPLLQVEFRVIFDALSYILLNGSKRNAIIVTYVNHKQHLWGHSFRKGVNVNYMYVLLLC